MLKEKKVCQSASEPEAKSSRETNADGVCASGLFHKAERPRRKQEGNRVALGTLTDGNITVGPGRVRLRAQCLHARDRARPW